MQVVEISDSLQGERVLAGVPSVFVRRVAASKSEYVFSLSLGGTAKLV
jgi:hypothetical protein